MGFWKPNFHYRRTITRGEFSLKSRQLRSERKARPREEFRFVTAREIFVRRVRQPVNNVRFPSNDKVSHESIMNHTGGITEREGFGEDCQSRNCDTMIVPSISTRNRRD